MACSTAWRRRVPETLAPANMFPRTSRKRYSLLFCIRNSSVAHFQPLQDDCWKCATELLRMQKSKEYRLRLVLGNIFAGAKVSGTRRRQAVEQAILHRVANRFVVAD